ncbi:MAG: type VI secretion system tip protein VgrG [Cytophagaceae bacterium]
MATSVTSAKTGLITYTVTVEGKQLPGSYKILSIRVSKAINKIPFARISFIDGNSASPDSFKVGNSTDIEPGKKIEIKAGYNSKEETIFKGIITKNNLRINSQGESSISVEAKDEAVKMTMGRKNNVYVDKKDSDVMKEIISNHVLQKDIKETSTAHNELVQYYCNDWDFILMRSEVNGMIVIADDGKITISEPDPSQSAILSVGYGTGLFSFNADIDVRTQLSKVEATAWDRNEQATVKSTASSAKETSTGAPTTKKLDDVINSKDFSLQSNAHLSKNVLDDWAKGKLIKSYLSKVQGKAKFYGNSKAKPGTTIEFSGLSKQFNGNAYIGAVEHIIEDGGWYTEVQLGLNFDWVSEEIENIDAPPASGLLPPIKGLTTAIVKQIHEDKEGQYRVAITIPSLEKDNQPLWARLTNMYASNDYGVFFYPEIGDEVIVGFVNEDPTDPIILGSVHSKKNPPPYVPDEENPIKGFVTKSKLKITFDDKDKILTIETPGENTFILDDKDGSITLEDKNKNKVYMSSSGIELSSDKDISLEAKGKITLKATSNIELEATGDLKQEGMQVAIKGKAKFAAEGAMAELKGSGQTTIKGGIVMIN